MVKAGMVLGNRYQILEKIGSGGMSDVYKAKDYKLNREVAIKVLKQEFNADESFISKFKTEAHAAACLSHPNIVHVFDVGDEADLHYIVMELVEGITLKTYISKKGKLEIRETIGISMQVAQGIEAAHQQHIVHRDIKPQNIIISRDGKVKVTDFGIAKATSTETVASNTMGSVHYISPEQARGGFCDERSDIYSLGITMFEMLTGRVPYDGDSAVSVALLHIQGELPSISELNPKVPVSLDKIIQKCTQKKAELRYRTISELIVDLKKALMNPNEDFVKIGTLSSNGPTRVLSAEEMDQIRSGAAQKKVEPVQQEERPVRKVTKIEPVEEDELLPEYDEEDEDEYDEDDGPSRTDRVFTFVGIAIALVIVALALFILGKAFGLFDTNGTKSGNKLTGATETTVPMPNVVGMNINDAIALLAEDNLGVKLVYTESQDVAADLVMSQEYEENTDVARYTKVKVTVSRGSSYTTIPTDLVGKGKEEVVAELEALGLTAVMNTCYSDNVKEGLVARVSPGQGSNVANGSSVTVYISLGPDESGVEVPDLLGLSQARAKSRLEAYGLELGSVSEEYSDTYDEGEVMWQSETPGTEVEEGSKVSIRISKGKKAEEEEEDETTKATKKETTEAPTTEQHSTEAPTTEAPTTEAPTTEAPTPEAPSTEAPTQPETPGEPGAGDSFDNQLPG